MPRRSPRVRFRDERDPYTNVIDCVNRIVTEEGWQTFFRGWWISVLTATLSAVAVVLQYLI